MSGSARRLYQFGLFTIDPVKRLLWRGEEIVMLKPKVFETLLLLVENRGRIIDKEELMARLWPDTAVEENSLNKKISELRRQLGERPSEHRYIVTVPGRGYNFVADVSERDAADSAPVRPSISRTEAGRQEQSIAVLPFRQLTPNAEDAEDAENEYLGVGIADALITRLSNFAQISVRPTSTIVRYAGLDQDPVEIGRQLAVESVLEGSIRRSGDRIRVTSQLVSVAEGRSLWADKFDEKFTDIFAVEDRVSEQIATVLMPRLTGEERRLLRQHYTENSDAYQAYLQGRYYWNKGTVEGVKKGIECFRQAADFDPDFALAYAATATCFVHLVAFDVLPPQQCYPRAREAAIRALAIDPRLAEARVALAQVKLVFDRDLEGAEQEHMRLVEVAPHLAMTHFSYAFYLMTQGREEAVTEIEKALSLDPVSLIVKGEAGRVFYYLRRYDEAIAVCRQALEMEPGFYLAYLLKAGAYEQKGDYQKAIANYEEAARLFDNPRMRAQAIYAYAMSGQRSATERLLGEIIERSKQAYVSPCFIAQVYAVLGDSDRAFEWLEKAYEERDFRMVFLKVAPRLDPLRADPRFADLLLRMGLA